MKLTARAAGSLAVTVALPASIAAGAARATAQPPGVVRAITVSSHASPIKAIRWGSTRFIVGSVARNIVSFDSAIKEHVDLRMVFMNWGSAAFPATEIQNNAKAGVQSVLELMPRNKSLIGIGDPGNTVYNHWLHDFLAPKIAALRIPITISFASEMNGPWYSWGFRRFTPHVYVRAWRHIHDLLAGTSAGPLVTWMWQPSAIHFTTPDPVPWFPGSKYVNIIGLDGYFVLPADNFDVIFGKTIKLLHAATTVPIMVGETSIGWFTGHAQLDMRRLFRGIRSFRLKGLVWFNINQRSSSIYHEDWRIQDRPGLLPTLIREITWTEQLRSVP
jgi:glycosyl hydrolase family 26